MTLNEQFSHLPKYLSVREVAEYTCCHDRTVRRWIQAGQLVALERPEGLRVPRSALRRFLGIDQHALN
ncbi:excisionase family DNA binding protein [Deinobacterium chartae]|uniref:Excisionase family DNA binding protein n=1 Tax=Deinobacterium chartae TaxID=521158 RepID=A0A841I369_9DEIO|nr:helix-turn-helix domain-containing protein [Deinobacterium chartae]MBB6099474.1 excisionase family DNA binding protein [Deinobacterium chartae]